MKLHSSVFPDHFPNDLKKVIRKVVKFEGYHAYSNAALADGWCEIASINFNSICEEVNELWKIRLVAFSKTSNSEEACNWKHRYGYNVYSYDDVDHDWYKFGCNWPGHVISLIGNWAIDFTARQFTPYAPFPLLFKFYEF